MRQCLPGAAARLRIARLLVLLCIAVSGPWAWALARNDTLHRIAEDTQRIEVTDAAWILEDSTGKLTADEVGALAERGQMKPVANPKTPALRMGGAPALWVKIDVEADPSAPPDWLLVVGMPILDRVQVFTPSGNGKWVGSAETGSTLPFATRPIPHRNFVFPTRIAPGTKTSILVRVQDMGATWIKASLWQPAALHASDQAVFGLHCLFFGLAGGMLLYNLLLYVIVRDRRYLLYLGFIFCMTTALAGHLGWAGQYLWGDWGWWNSRSVYIGYCAAMVLSIALTRNFFSTRDRVPVVDKALAAMMWILCCGVAAGALLPKGISAQLLTMVSPFSTSLTFGLSLFALSRRWPGAAYFCAAWLAREGAALVAISAYLFLVPRNITLPDALAIGLSFEMILLSLALADRINEERRQKEGAQALTLAILRASQAISSETRLDRLYARMREVMIALTGASGIQVVLWDADLKGWFLYEDQEGGRRTPAADAARRGVLAISALDHAQAARQPLIVDDVLQDERFAHDPAFAGLAQCSLLVLPILQQASLSAVLVLENRGARGAFSSLAADSLTSIAGPLAVSLENALLYERLEQRVAEQTRELREAQDQLVATARRAGMAEIATNVLHNVGNILNSVNVAAEVVSAKLRNSRVGGLARAVQMFETHAGDLGEFMTRDEKGRLLPGYLRELSVSLERERQESLALLAELSTNIDHIKSVVATQQVYAGRSSFVVRAQPGELLEAALRMNDGSLERHRVTVVKELEDLPALLLDKTRVLQILVNLITNAKQAMDSVEGPRTLMLRMAADDSTLRFVVRDAGCGIAAENMVRIFSHGFTTRAGGHGFGLHSCALAAIEMGGRLTAHSEGTGCGATFTLELPLQPIDDKRRLAALPS
jgi:signal transduction histidine kinase